MSVSRQKQNYYNTHRSALKQELKLSNVHEVPTLEKIVISVGTGRAKDDKRLIEAVENTLSKIAGQKPVKTLAKKSIASFKLREGNSIGYKVTLRGVMMYEFLDRFINLVLPRLRDFRGLSLRAFDGQSNYNIGLKDQSVFPELEFQDTSLSHGLQITFVTSTNDKNKSEALLKKFGMPFEKGKEEG